MMKIILKTWDGSLLISLNEVQRIEAKGRFTVLYTEKECYQVMHNLKDFLGLGSDHLIKLNQSNIINLNAIVGISDSFIYFKNKNSVAFSCFNKCEIENEILDHMTANAEKIILKDGSRTLFFNHEDILEVAKRDDYCELRLGNFKKQLIAGNFDQIKALLTDRDFSLEEEDLLINRKLIGEAENKKVQPNFNGLSIKYKDYKINIAYNNILKCVAEGSYTCVYTVDGLRYIYSVNLGEICKSLPDRLFFRIHRSTIVNCNLVRSIRKEEILLSNNSSIEVSRRRRSSFMEFLQSDFAITA